MSYSVKETNVLVIGCGGAGLRAAIEAKLKQKEVIVLGKRPKNDAHTVLAAGGVNASFGNVDFEDNWKEHFLDTFLEGYGIGNTKLIEILTKDSPLLVEEIDSWGANLEKLENGKLDQRFFGAHKYRRTCYSGDFTGSSILLALLKKALALNIPIFDDQYVTELIVEDKTCLGAFSFNVNTGEKTFYRSNSTILCTGGHTKIWARSTSRESENTGDGIHLGLEAGCELIDMEMVQFHPTGLVSPESMVGNLVTEAVRGEGGKLINSNGKRFMIDYDPKRLELSTRDKVALANYTEIIEGRCTKKGAVYLDVTHLGKNHILKKLPSTFNQILKAQGLDISKEKFEVAPTAHYSMGGININPENNQTLIKGLFAAGEVTGGLHGANRLGGNSLAEILVFGKRAGFFAAEYSDQYLKKKSYDNNLVNKALQKISNLMKNGSENISQLDLILRDIMWKNCGVVKNEIQLNKAIEELNKLKYRFEKIHVEKDDFKCLAKAMDLKYSISSAHATLISSLLRKESRGAFQRTDFRKLENNYYCNFIVKKNKNTNDLFVSKLERSNLDKDLFNSLDLNLNSDTEGKLLE